MDGYGLDDVAPPAAPAAKPAAVKSVGYSLDDVAAPAAAPAPKYETTLTPREESQFTSWKATNAPNDSGEDYDLRGAFKANVKADAATGHWPDTFKKPNHPTFSDQSQYAKDAPDRAGTWKGDVYVPPAAPAATGYSLDDVAVEAPGQPSQGFATTAGGAATGVEQPRRRKPTGSVMDTVDTTKLPNAAEQPSTLAPVSAQKYRELQNLNTTDPAAIQRMAKKEGVLGDAARKIMGETAQPAAVASAITPKPAPSTQAVMDTQRGKLTEWRRTMTEQKPEILAYIKRASPFIDDNAADETYTRWLKDPRSLPPEVAEDYFGRKSNLNPLERGVATGMLNLWQSAQGGAQAISDTIGTHALSQRMREEEAGTERTIKQMGRSPAHDGLTGALKRDFESVVASIVQQAPTLGAAAAFKAPQVAGALGMMGVQSFGQEYANGTRNGLRPSEAADRASIFASFEVIGELFGFPQYIRAMKSAMRGVPTKALVGELSHAITADIPGEQLTTLGQFLADKDPRYGLNPQAGIKEYMQQVRDTLTQTVMQGGVMGGAALAMHGGHHLLPKDDQVGKFLKEWAQSIEQAKPVDTDTAAREALNPDNAQVQRVEEPAHHVESRKDVAALSSLLNDERPLHEIIAERTATADGLRQDQARAEQAHADEARAASDSELAQLGVPPAGTASILTWPDGAHLTGTIESASPTSVVFKTDDGETYTVNPRDREAEFALAPKGAGTPSNPIVVEDMAHVEQAAKRIDEGRSWPQIEAGNDRKAHVVWHGIPITIEVGKGDVRESHPDAPTQWSIEMPHAYGYAKGSRSADGEESDVAIVGMHPTAHIFDTLNTDTGAFDEHKTILGAGTMRAATQALKAMYNDGAKDRIGGMIAMSIPEYKSWLKSDAATAPVIFNQPAGISLDEVADATPAREQQRDDLGQHSGVPSGEHVRENETEIREGQSEQAGDRGGLLERTAPPERAEAGDRERGGQERQGEGRPSSGNGEQRVEPAVSAEPVKPALSSETIARIQKSHQRVVEKDEQKKRGIERRKKAEQNKKRKAESKERHEDNRAKSEMTRDVREQLKSAPKVENGVVVEGATKGYQSFDLTKFPQTERRVTLAVGGLFDEIDADDPRFSLGARDNAETPTNTDAFKDWFGASILTVRGQPLVLYHGTQSEFDAFDMRHTGKDEAHFTSALGFFFSPSKEFVKAKYAGDTGRVLSFYLNLKRPFIMPVKDTLNIESHADAVALRKKLIDEGYDGIIVPKNDLGFKGYVIAFEPTSIKATDNFGTWSKTDQRFKYSRGLDDVFYSALARAIDNMPLKAASAQQWKASIKNLVQKGIKQMEIDATGINDWLDLVEYDGTPENKLAKISKENVVYYLKANGVQVKENILGDPNQVMEIEVSDIQTDEPDNDYLLETAKDVYLDEAIADLAHSNQIPPEEVDRDDAMEIALRQATNAYYDEPTSSGHVSVSFMGERYQYRINYSYGELDIWRDDGQGESIHNKRGFLDKPEIEAIVRADVLKKTGQEEAAEGVKFDNWKLPGGDEYQELLLILPPAQFEKPLPDGQMPFKERFQSSHFEEENVLAHVRFDTRKDADGKRVLFVEEFQSDWAQRGREEGFRSNNEPSKEEQIETTKAVREVLKANDQLGFDTLGEAMIAVVGHSDWADRWEVDTPEQVAIVNRYRDVQIAVRAARSGVVPAPFVTKTEAWLALLMKRMIRYAAEKDFDRIAWATGAQNADHYKLSKHIDTIGWQKGEHGKIVHMRGAGGYRQGSTISVQVNADGVIDGSNRSDRELSGKHLSEVVGRDLAEKIMQSEEGDLAGVDIDVGGSGMKQFYDKIVPNVANDILKKLGGDRVKIIEIKAGNAPDATVEHWRRVDPNHPLVKNSRWQQMGFDITPKLKETALGGMPLFSRGAHFSDRYLTNQAEITKRVVELAKQIAPSAHVKVVEQLFASGRSAVRSGAATEDKVEAAGYYDALRDLITVALRYDNPSETVRHETVHHLRAAGLINDAEWAVLTKQAEAEWNGRYGVSDVEEAIAYAFGSYRGGERYGGMVARVFAKIREFLQRLANLLHGMGFQTWGDVFARLETGQIGRRGVQPAAIGETAHASIGTPADENETIKAWSVDPEKVPVGEWAGRIVFHGTSAAGAESITGDGVDISASSGGYFGRAFYVASDESLARSNYAEFSDDDDGGKVVAVRIKPDANILDMRSPDAWEEYTAVMKGHDVSDPNIDAVMRAAGVDGVFDRSFGGVAIYNPDAVEPYKFGGDKLFGLDRDQTDSAAFKAWFDGSKVVDEQGNPLRAYHGTAADFGVFNTDRAPIDNARAAWSGDLGSWFSAPSLMTGNYDDGNAEYVAESFLEGKEFDTYKDGANVMPVYLAIKNPAEYEGWDDYYYAKGGWKADTKAFRAALIKKGFDGVVIRNSMTDGDVDRDDWIAFEPTQIKSAIGNRGTFDATNPDVRYSTGDDSDLIIQHNVTAANVMHADRMGGLAVPSLAITKADDAMINFGEITLIGDRNMADPRGYARTQVFGADIYSPRYPTVHYKFTQNNVDNMKRMLAPAIAATRGIDWDDVQKRGAAQFENEPAVMWQLLTDRGIVPNIVMEKGITKKRVAELKRAGLEKYFGRTDWQSLAHDEEFAKLVHADIQREYERAGATDLMTPWEKTSSSRQVNGAIQHAHAMGKVGAPEKVNASATRDALRSQVRKLPDGDLAFYSQQLFDKLDADEKLFKGYNNYGNKTYKPHTLDNVVRELKKSIRGGEGFNYGLGSARSKVTPQFSSIKAIREQKDRIVSKEKIEEFKKIWDAQLHEIWEDAAQYHDNGKNFGFGDTLIDSLAESASRGLDRALKDNAFDVERMPQELKDRMSEFVDEMREWPTEYFEAKILRSVDLSEFKAAVVPKGTNKRVIELLESKGLHVATYNPKASNGNGVDRKRVIADIASKLDVRFSLGEQEQAAEDANAALTGQGHTGTIEFEREPSPFGAGKLADDITWLQRFAVHPRTIATMNKDFAPVYLAAVHQFEHRDEIAAGLQRHAQPYFDLPRDSKERVNAALELGRLTGTVYGTGNTPIVITNDSGRPDALLAAGETLTLDDREKSGYWAIRRTMDAALVAFKEQVIREWGLDPAMVSNAREIMDAIPAGATTADRDRYAQVAMLVREIDEARKKGYVPFNRQGQVGILVRERGVADEWEADGKTATKHFEMVEVDGLLQKAGRALKLTSSEMEKMSAVKERVDALKALYPEHDIRVFQVAPNAPIAGDVKMSDLDMLASVAQIDEGAWTQVRAGLQDALQRRGFRKHFFGSQNVPGYSQDFERSIADYIVGISGYLARRQASPKWDEAIANIPTEKPWLMKYAQGYRDYANNPVEEFAGLRQAAFFYYLAGVPSTALINATQVSMITAPYLTQFANAARVTIELTAAYKDAATMLRFGSDVFNPASAPDDIREEFQQAWDEGFFVPITTYEMMGLAHNRMPALRHMAKRARQTLDTVSYLFNAAERTNRVVTFIAAVRLAKSQGFAAKVSKVLAGNMLARADLMREFTPAKFAEFVIDETHFRMGKVNRPGAMRGVGAALLQFKGFTFQAVELYGRIASQNGIQGKKAFALMMMMLMMTSGLWGLPFGKNYADLMEFLYKRYTDIDLDLKTKVREFIYKLTGSPRLARAFTDGALSQTIGVDVGARIGQGQVLPESASDIGGVPLSLTIGKAGQALDYAQRGQGMLALAEIMPNFIKNPLTAYVWGEEGVKSQSTGKVFMAPEQVTTADQAKKAIGFTPFKLANIREAEYAVKRAEHEVDALRADYYAKLATTYAKAQRADDAGRTKEAMQFEIEADKLYNEIEKFNTGRADHEQVRIDPKALQNRVREELYGFELRKGKERKQARDRAEEIRQIYGTEVAGGG